jgi:hypothetical protein
MTIEIGLTGPEHTRNDGYKLSNFTDADGPNRAGQVAGYSYRYNGGADFVGNNAWLYNGVTTIDIGLAGPEHTRNDGTKTSRPWQLNEAGQVSGISTRYNGGSSDLGSSAWLYDGTTTIQIGLTGPEYTRNDGFTIVYANSNTASHLNQAGQVLGISGRFNGGSASLGSTAWLYDGTTTLQIGLTGPEQTRDDGFKQGFPLQLNEAGQARGYSPRYNGGSTPLGYNTWLYNGTTTIQIGLTGPEHTRNDGYKASWTEDLNETGQVRGYSERFNGGGTQLGQDAWVYDPVLDQTIALNLSTRSDGYAFSRVTYLGDDGLALGTYTLFDALDINLGDRAFYFTVADGLHDLGSLVEGGLAANDWDSLASAVRVKALGQFLGRGKLNDASGSQMVYLLTPAVPEPSTLLLGALVAPALLWRVRRLRCTQTDG